MSHLSRRGRVRHLRVVVSLCAPLAISVASACGASSGTSTALGSQTASSTQSPTPSGTPAFVCVTSGACVTITVAIAGDQAVSGMERQPRSACTDLLVPVRFSGQELLDLPSPRSIGGHTIVSAFGILGYHGPGDYGREVMFTGEDNSLGVDGSRYAEESRGAGGLTATIRPDGSGEFRWSRLFLATDARRSISGSVSWTCAAGS